MDHRSNEYMNWKIKHALDATDLSWVLHLLLNGPEPRHVADDVREHADNLAEVVSIHGREPVLREVLWQSGKLESAEHDDETLNFTARAAAELEVANLPEGTLWMGSNLPAPEHTHEPATEPVDGCTRCEIEQGNRQALVDLIDTAGPEFVVRTIDELAGFPDNGMVAPATISESFHENDEPSLAEQVADRLSPASLLGLDAEDEYDDDQHRMITRERGKLDLGLDRALDGTGLALEALDELVSNGVYDVEYAEGREGDDLRAHLEAAARELRAAGRIAESVNRR